MNSAPSTHSLQILRRPCPCARSQHTCCVNRSATAMHWAAKACSHSTSGVYPMALNAHTQAANSRGARLGKRLQQGEQGRGGVWVMHRVRQDGLPGPHTGRQLLRGKVGQTLATREGGVRSCTGMAGQVARLQSARLLRVGWASLGCWLRDKRRVDINSHYLGQSRLLYTKFRITRHPCGSTAAPHS